MCGYGIGLSTPQKIPGKLIPQKLWVKCRTNHQPNIFSAVTYKNEKINKTKQGICLGIAVGSPHSVKDYDWVIVRTHAKENKIDPKYPNSRKTGFGV